MDDPLHKLSPDFAKSKSFAFTEEARPFKINVKPVSVNSYFDICLRTWLFPPWHCWLPLKSNFLHEFFRLYKAALTVHWKIAEEGKMKAPKNFAFKDFVLQFCSWNVYFRHRCSIVSCKSSLEHNKYKYTNRNTQIYKHKYTNTDAQIQMHKYKYKDTQKYTNFRWLMKKVEQWDLNGEPIGKQVASERFARYMYLSNLT